MPARDSFGDEGDGDLDREVTPEEGDTGGDTGGDPDDGIEVNGAGTLAEPSIVADPGEEPGEYLIEVAEASVADPVAAGDEIGTLLSILREREGDHREDVSLILEHLGDVRPAEFEVWTEDLRALAESPSDEVAFVGLRSFAQLATENPGAATAGLDPGLKAIRSDDPSLRRAGLALVAEVGPHAPDEVRSADGPIAAALRDERSSVRVAGAIAAGRVLAADPSFFPRTATALPEVLEDDHERVRRYAHVALANFVLERPGSVPEKERAIEALAGVTDRELGLREGAIDEALSSLLELVNLG